MERALPLLKLRTAAVLRALEARAYVADWRGPAVTPRKKLLIYGQGRSGSTLLEQLLVSTGHFTGHHEVLNTVTREVIWPTAYVRGLGRAWSSGNIVVHVKPEHLGRSRKQPVASRSFLEALSADHWHIVHIKRLNVMRMILSKDIAKSRGAFHKTDDKVENIRIEIPEAEFLDRYDKHMRWLEEETALMQDFSHFQVVCERDLEPVDCHQSTVDRILDGLDLPHRPVKTQLRKISNAPPVEILRNYYHLRSACEARGLEWTL